MTVMLLVPCLAVQDSPCHQMHFILLLKDSGGCCAMYQLGYGIWFKYTAKPSISLWRRLLQLTRCKYREGIHYCRPSSMPHMPPYHWKGIFSPSTLNLSDQHFEAYILFAFLALFPVHSVTVNFLQCLIDVTSCA